VKNGKLGGVWKEDESDERPKLYDELLVDSYGALVELDNLFEELCPWVRSVLKMEAW